MAPMLPLAVAGIIRVWGDGAEGAYALQWIATLLLAIQLSLWPFLARRLGMGFAAGAAAAVTFLSAGIVLFPMWEAMYVGLCLVILTYCAHRILQGAASWVLIIATGIVAGITLLFNPVPLLPSLALFTWIYLSKKVSRTKALALAGTSLLVIAPWLIRNYRVFGHFILIRDNLGLELAVSNNSCAPFWFWGNAHGDCFHKLHPNESIFEAERVRDLGEYRYNEERRREGMQWIRQNPRAFLQVSSQRFLAFWFPTPAGNAFKDQRVSPQMLVVWFLALLSVPGLWLLWRKDRVSAGITLIWLALFPPVYYIVQYDIRYRYPILWATFLPGCYFLTEMARGLWKAVAPQTNA